MRVKQRTEMDRGRRFFHVTSVTCDLGFNCKKSLLLYSRHQIHYELHKIARDRGGQGQQVGQDNQLEGSPHHQPVVDIPQLDIAMEKGVVSYKIKSCQSVVFLCFFWQNNWRVAMLILTCLCTSTRRYIQSSRSACT